jgi:hypothetical protein
MAGFTKLLAGTALLLATFLVAPAHPVCAAEINPFDTFNQSPLVQIYGLLGPGRAKVLRPGENEVTVGCDLANNFAHDANQREAVFLDGETIRSRFAYSRGFAGGYEAGIELPVLYQSGGFLDGFIEGWHSFFGLYNGTRGEEPKNRLLYQYIKDGTVRIRQTRDSAGIGDLRLSGATQLYRQNGSDIALRGLLKLPTGDSASLFGSGSTDLSLWLSADHDFPFQRFGHATVFGSSGVLVKTRGDVLADQERPLVWFGNLGAGWNPNRVLVLKLQVSSHTPFYRDSDLIELNGFVTQLTYGVTIAFSEKLSLDFGMSEDVAIDRSPDTTFHLSLSKRF